MAQRSHPHAEATYRVIPLDDGAFAVELTIPETYPAKVSPFATKADAEAWIAEHRRRVQSENEPSRWFAAQAPVEASVAAAQDSRVVFVARSQPLARWVVGNSERKVAFLRPSGGGSCQLLVALRGL